MTRATITRDKARLLLDFCKKHKLQNWFFAKDQGAYFGANAGSHESNSFENCIHYVEGCDPNQDESKNGDWYDNAREKFGGDDFGEMLPVQWLEIYFKDERYANKRTFGININKNSITLID